VSTLLVRDLVAGYGGLDILHGVSIDVGPDEIVTIIGPNGTGKSTLLKKHLRPGAASGRLRHFHG